MRVLLTKIVLDMEGDATHVECLLGIGMWGDTTHMKGVLVTAM